ncbi:MAG TPA: WD40 repeat domain-containing protein, partial [Kofleriaceae bacterium]|nr:WD40 repeat domain-containing protein [Kofleriaceae bacterium]
AGLAALAASGCGSCSKEAGSPPLGGDGGLGPPGARQESAGPSVSQADQAGPKDALGDPLPAGAIARLGSLRMLDRHLEQMIFLPGGAQLVSASYDRYVVWDAATGRRLFELQRADTGPALAVTPSGQRLATSVVGSREIQIWDLAERKALDAVQADGEVKALCYLDETALVAGAEGVVTVLGAPGAEPVRVSGGFDKLTSIACGGGKVIAVGDDSGAVHVIDLRKELVAAARLGAARKRIAAVAVSRDGARVAAAAEDGTALVWSLAAPAEPVVIQAHDGAVASVVFSPDGSRLWTSGGDPWLRAWNPADGALIKEMTAADGLTVQLMALSPDGKRAATWSEHRGAKGSEAGRFWLWDLATGDPLAEPERHLEPLTGIAYSPDGALIATSSEDDTVRLWEAQSGKARSVLTSAQGAVNALEFARGGELIYSAGADARLVGWRHADDTVADALPPIGGKVNAFDVAADGSRAITGDETGRVWMWDLAARARLQALDRRTYASVTTVALSPDGKLAAMGGSERVVLVIGTGSGSEIARLTPDVVSHYAVTFSPDGAILATASDDGRVRLWDTRTWKLLRALEGHDGPVRCVAFSRDGTLLASGSSDGTARVWEVATGSEKKVLSGHQGAVSGVAFSPDGARLATASRDRTALIWEL